MLPRRSSHVPGAITKSSEISIWAGPSSPSSAAHCARVKMRPPLMATISPAAIASFANKPWPSMGLAFTSVFGDR